MFLLDSAFITLFCPSAPFNDWGRNRSNKLKLCKFSVLVGFSGVVCWSWTGVSFNPDNCFECQMDNAHPGSEHTWSYTTKVFLKLIMNEGWSMWTKKVAFAGLLLPKLQIPFGLWLLVLRVLGGTWTGGPEKASYSLWLLPQFPRWRLAEDTAFLLPRGHQASWGQQHSLKSYKSARFLLSFPYLEASVRTQLLRWGQGIGRPRTC